MTRIDDRIRTLADERAELEARLGDPDLIADHVRYAEVSRRYKELDGIVGEWRRLDTLRDELDLAREMAAEAAGDERELLDDEIRSLSSRIDDSEAQLAMLLLPKDPNDGRNVIMEIRGAEGGEEANLFARDLHGMYVGFAKRRGWRVETLGASPSDMGGFSEVTLLFKGADVWAHLKNEGGTHRVQRVPVTESQGRVHTSSATVAVLPEADEVEVDIDENDLHVDVFRSSGPGGQSVNTTDSAVRITHRPTGIVVSMQDEKSQIQNRAKALRVLRSRLLKLEQDLQAAELSEQRRDQVGAGGRADKVRTYNFKENRLSDHRIGLTIYKLDKVLAGELDEVSDALLLDEQQHRLSGDI